MGVQGLLIANVASHFLALMGGIVSFGVAVWEAIKKRKIRERVFWTIGAICLLVAFDMSWKDEHKNTQTVISEKAAEVSAKNSCFNDLKVLKTYVQGVELMNSTQRQTIDQQRDMNERQQSAVNSCVISLGKMNPVINTKIVVLNLPVGGVKTNYYKEEQFYETLITTNTVTRPVGDLKCEKSFDPIDAPQIPVLSNGVVMVAFNPAVPVNDHEYHIRITNTGSDWGPNSPIYLRVKSNFSSLGKCSFTPE